MTTRNTLPLILKDEEFQVPSGKPGFRRALLINPPVYDAQYWARWSQPAGLLRIASLLNKKGYSLDLVDCMETNANGYVPKTWLRGDDNLPLFWEKDGAKKQLWHFGLSWKDFERRLDQLEFGGNPGEPDEIWVTSIMTYWWESTRDAINRLRVRFPTAEIYVGGIYPTLAPDHAQANLNADVIFTGEIKEASNLPTYFGLYRTPPSYAILTTSRGCPWDCSYCAARTLNGGQTKVRKREPEDVIEEMKYKQLTYGVRHFGFYEDNALIIRNHLQEILEMVIEKRKEIDPRGRRLQLYAPEGFETRLLTEDLLRVMKQAGFEKIHLPFETLRWETTVGWNRRHASTASFDAALSAAIKAGFRPRTPEINAFVLFGLPDERLEDILDSAMYVHHNVGSVIPMLFTPVPGTHIYREQSNYLHNQMGYGLEDLNGKFLPFLEYNRARHYPNLRAADYLELEGLMTVLNDGKFLSTSVNLCDESIVSTAFRSAVETLEASHN